MFSTKANLYKKTIITLVLIVTLSTLTGCGFFGNPRPRAGFLPTDTHGIDFANPDRLGKHSYGFTLNESGGIIYTCDAGHLDLSHVRGNADNTKYLNNKVRKTLMKGSKGFTFSITGEMSKHKIKFTYPPDWENNPNKEKIINEITYATGPYLSYQATIWHEILTWFGVHFMGFEPEFNSAFSWEDMYSNVLGTQLAVKALRQGKDFDQAMTELLDEKLKELNVQPKSVAIKASDKVRGKWYTGNFIPDMKIRNLDIGLDGYIAPVLIPGIEECPNPEPEKIKVPTLETLRSYGFDMTHQISPNVFEQGRIYKAAGTKDIRPEKHYPIIMKEIERQARKKGYKIIEE